MATIAALDERRAAEDAHTFLTRESLQRAQHHLGQLTRCGRQAASGALHQAQLALDHRTQGHERERTA